MKLSRRQIAYRKYLKSDHWKLVRGEAVLRDGHKCVECGDNYRLNVHHHTYPSDWYQTSLEHVITLCRDCHRLEHGLPMLSLFENLYRHIWRDLGAGREVSVGRWLALEVEAILPCEIEDLITIRRMAYIVRGEPWKGQPLTSPADYPALVGS